MHNQMNSFDAIIEHLNRIKDFTGLIQMLHGITSEAGDILSGATVINEDLFARDALLYLVVIKIYFCVVANCKSNDASVIARNMAEQLRFYQRICTAISNDTMPLTHDEDNDIVYN
jgi:hypothetical protein